MKFSTMTQIGPWHRINRKNLEFFGKSKKAAAAILKNHKNRDISTTVLTIFMKFGTVVQNGPLNC